MLINEMINPTSPETKAAVLQVFGIIFTTALTVVFTLWSLRRQHSNERLKRKEEKDTDLKKQLYIDVLYNFTLLMTTYVAYSDVRKKTIDLDGHLTETLANIQRIHLVSSDEIIFKLTEFNHSFMDAYLEILNLRNEFEAMPKEATSEDRLEKSIEMLETVSLRVEPLQKLITELIIDLREDLKHPFQSPNYYREIIDASQRRSSQRIFEIINRLKKLIEQ